MNDQISIGQLEVQNLQKVADGVWADAETLDWFMLTVDVEEGDGVRPCVANLVASQPMPVGRPEDSDSP